MMVEAWRLGTNLARGIYRTSEAISKGVVSNVQEASVARAGRAARGGVLGPGAADPPPGFDYYDYRGVSRPRDVRHLQGLPFSLGRIIDPTKGPRGPIGLSMDHMARHAVLIGSSGSGKTASLIVPWIARAVQEGAAVVALDVTGNLLNDVLDYRAVVGPLQGIVGKWDFTDVAHSLSWNWLEELTTTEAVVGAVDALIGRENVNDPQPYFAQRDRRILRALIECVIEVESSPRSKTLLDAARNLSNMKRVAALSVQRGHRLSEIVQLDPADFSRAMSGIVNALDFLEQPGVQAVTQRSSLSLPSLFRQPSLLVVGAPLHGSRTSVAASSLILSQIIRLLYTRFGSAGRQVFLVLDEAARLTDRLNFEELLSVSRGAGVTVVLAIQTVTQFKEENERAAILDNCSTCIVLPSPSKASADYFTSRLGSRQQSTLSVVKNVSRANTPSSQYSRNTESVGVLGPREVMDPPFGPRAALVHSPEAVSAPMVVDLTRFDLVR